MMSERSQSPFLLVLLTVGLLGLLSLLPASLTIGSVELRPVRLLADVLRKPSPRRGLRLPLPNGPAAPGPAKAGGAATATTAQPADSAAALPAAPTEPNLPGLENFVAALRQTKATGRQTRIAYFGDSMIEGDMITGELRNLLQRAFGGSGVGFVPVNSITADFRETILQSFSDTWYEYNLTSDKIPAASPLGVSGHVFLPRELPAAGSGVTPDTSWVQFKAGPAYATTRRLPLARLFYGPGNAQDQVIVTTNGHRVPHALPGAATVNELVLKPGSPARVMRFDFANHGPRPVYGVSFEGEGGVVLDNFSFRGNSGMSLTKIPPAQLAAFGRHLNYNLVVLQYGVNIADARNKSYDWYARAMTRVVDRMHRAFPGASILIVGMSDKSSRIDGEFQTDPSVPRLLKSQRQLAERNQAAFWNLYDAMGGENSMVRWVEDTPPLANKDYTHVNYRGGRKVANLLYNYLMAEYNHPGAAAAEPVASATPTKADSAVRPAPRPALRPDSANR